MRGFRDSGEPRLRAALREVPVPDAAGAERRGLAVVEAAFAERRPERRSPLPRLALAMAIAALLAALLLSPAGAEVRDWVGDVFTAGAPNPEPGLTEIPGGGRLLVQTPAGPWVVQPDGSRRLLGPYREATWSPRGLFVGAAAGHTLSAVEPDGTPHWSLTAAGAVSDPRWSPSGFQIAYRSGSELRLVEADGSEDRSLAARVRPVPAAWAPEGLAALAYVDARGRLRVADSESGEPVGSAAALPGIAELEWSPNGSALLEASGEALRVRGLRTLKLQVTLRLEGARAIELPASARVADAAFSPDGRTVAALLRLGAGARARSEVVLAGADGGRARPLFRTPGRLSQLAFSPDGSRLLIAWPEADQWLFIPGEGRGRTRAIGSISSQFAPQGGAAAFPSVAGWCCRETVPLGG